MAKLIFIDPEFSGQTYALIMEKTTVGRHTENVLVLRHDTVSSHHCEIFTNDPEVIVRDLGSRNGTFVDGVQIVGQRQVKSGQVIRFGQVEARLELGKPPMEDDTTQETAVRFHQIAMREVGRAPAAPEPQAQPQPRDPTAAASGPGDATILSPRPVSTPMAAPTPASEPPPPSAGRSNAKLWVRIGVAVAVVVLALWWWLSRR